MDIELIEIREEQLRQWSRGFPYPPTPEITGAISQRLAREGKKQPFPQSRLAWVAVVLLLLASLMAVPAVRAQVLEFLQLGAIRIILTEPTYPPDRPLPSLTAGETGSQIITTATAAPPAAVYPSISDLAGETTLAEARDNLDFPILLPAYPLDLGKPDRIFFQDFEGPAVLLVWMDPEQAESIRMDLLILGSGTFAQKGSPAIIEETRVNGNRAIWTEGSHFLHLGGSMYQTVTLVVEGNILIWEQDGITYRLETNLPLEEAVRVAESLK